MAKNRSTRRKNRASRRNRNNRRSMYGGMSLAPQDINDTSMMSPQKLSVAQGGQFADLTRSMHGGMAPYPGGVTDSGLPQNLQASARLVGLNESFDYIKGMKDVAGGRRRRSSRKSRKNRKASRKNRKSRKSRKNRKASRKNRKASRKNRKTRGGALGYAPSDMPGMLLDAAATARAGLNPEWANDTDLSKITPK